MCVNQSPPPSGSHSALKPTETTPSRPARDEMIIHTYHPQSTTWDGSKTQSMEVAQVAPAITKAWKLLFSKVAPGDTLRQGRNNQGPTNRKKEKIPFGLINTRSLTKRWITANAQIFCHPSSVSLFQVGPANWPGLRGHAGDGDGTRHLSSSVWCLAMESVVFFRVERRHREGMMTGIAAVKMCWFGWR